MCASVREKRTYREIYHLATHCIEDISVFCVSLYTEMNIQKFRNKVGKNRDTFRDSILLSLHSGPTARCFLSI